jgi:hypothetical protein
MSERTEHSESHEDATPADDAAAPEPKPSIPPGRRADSRGASRPHRPPNALGPFIPVGTE